MGSILRCPISAQPKIAVFCLFQCFEETEYQMESKRNETFGNVIFSPNVIQETCTLLQEVTEAVTRVGGPLGRAPYLVGPLLLHRRTPSSNIYLRIPERSEQEPKNLIPPPQPSVSMRSHLGACFGASLEGASTTEGFYIITIAPPMKCE